MEGLCEIDRRSVGVPIKTLARRTTGSIPEMGEPMPKNKGGREIRKPKQPKKPKTTADARLISSKIDAAVKKAK